MRQRRESWSEWKMGGSTKHTAVSCATASTQSAGILCSPTLETDSPCVTWDMLWCWAFSRRRALHFAAGTSVCVCVYARARACACVCVCGARLEIIATWAYRRMFQTTDGHARLFAMPMSDHKGM